MNKLQLVIKIYQYQLDHDSNVDIKKMMEELDLGKEYSLARIKRIEGQIDPSLVFFPNLSYNRELFVLDYLESKKNIDPYVKASRIASVMEYYIYTRVNTVYIRRYIKAIIEAGYQIETKHGFNGGYRLISPFMEKNKKI